MARILVFGMCPLPFENTNRLNGNGIRTWQFVRPLLDDGHEVTLVACRIPFSYDTPLPPVETSIRGRLTTYSVDEPTFEDDHYLGELIQEFRPDCIVGSSIYPSYRAAKVCSTLPLWVDIFGDVLAEAQVKAAVYKDDSYLAHFWQFLRVSLDRGDSFSTVSGLQRLAAIGQLASRGRLNQFTVGYEFFHSIPCAYDETQEVKRAASPVVRGIKVPADAFIVLWNGGFNTWTDVDTLFSGLQLAMQRDPAIHFVATGGQLDGHDDFTYPRFLQLIKESPYSNRFVMRGWVPTTAIPRYLGEANLAINIDAQHYEGLLGSRNRIVTWMQHGLPVLTTELGELQQLLRLHRLGFTFPIGDAPALASQITSLSAQPELLTETAAKAMEFARTHFTYAVTTQPLRTWVQHPRHAPDYQTFTLLEDLVSPAITVLREHIGHLEATAQTAHSLQAEVHYLQKQLKLKENQLQTLHKSRAVRYSSALAFLLNRLRGKSPIYGVLDLLNWDENSTEIVRVAGWAFSTAAPVHRIEALIGNTVLGTLPYGQERPDVMAAFPWLRDDKCGYAESFKLNSISPDQHTFTIRIIDKKGNTKDFTRSLYER